MTAFWDHARREEIDFATVNNFAPGASTRGRRYGLLEVFAAQSGRGRKTQWRWLGITTKAKSSYRSPAK